METARANLYPKSHGYLLIVDLGSSTARMDIVRTVSGDRWKSNRLHPGGHVTAEEAARIAAYEVFVGPYDVVLTIHD